MDPVISFHNVSKKLDHFSLSDLSLSIPKGYITGIIGPNGSGKTTFIKLIMNLLRPDSGEVKVFGEPYGSNEQAIKSKIGFVYEDADYYPHETVKHIKEIVAAFYPTWNEAEFERYREWFRLPKRKRIGTLSKGMKMKFSLALALSHDAELIIMDEPTSGLDPIFRRELLEVFREIMQNEDKTIVFSTHHVSDLERIADYIAFLDDGKLVFNQPKDELLDTLAIVRGPNDWLNHEMEKHFIGIRRNEVGFEGLSHEVSEIQGDHSLVIEKPTLEDVMFYVKKGGRS